MIERFKKIMVSVSMPLFFLLIGYCIVFVIALPYIRPMVSLYQMISQDQTPTFTNEQESFYNETDIVPEEGEITEVKETPVGTQFGRVVIPDVNIDIPLNYGSTEEVLYYGAGVRTQSSMPGYGKPVMIAGHTIPYFKNLGQIEVGDVIQLKTFYGLFTYAVSGTGVANASDTSAYDLQQNAEQLILFTCYPLDGIGEKEDRLFVYADKISGPSIVGDGHE